MEKSQIEALAHARRGRFTDSVRRLFQKESGDVHTSVQQKGDTKMEKNKKYCLSLSREEIAHPKIREALKEIISNKFQMQKYNDFIRISEVEFELINQAFRGEFVPKEKYNNLTTFKNEVGKMRGKKLIVE
jgi:hypothetical protein